MQDDKPRKFSISNLLHKDEGSLPAGPAQDPQRQKKPAQAHAESPGQLPPQPDLVSGGYKPMNWTQATEPSQAPATERPADRKEPPPAAGRPELEPVNYGPEPGDRQDSVDLFRYISILMRRRQVVIASCLAFFLFALFTSMQKPKLYMSKTQVLYKPLRSNDVLGGMDSYELWMDRENQLTTFEQIILSPEMMKRLAQKLSRPMEPNMLPGIFKVVRIEKSSILEIQSQHTDPYFTAEAANKLAAVFIRYNLEVSTEDISRTIRKLEEQIEKTGNELREKEDRVRAFQEQNQFVRATEETQLEVRKLSELEIQLQNANLRIQETQKRLDKIREELKKRNVDVKLESELIQLELDLAVNKSKYGEEHPRTKGTKQKIQYLRTLIDHQKAKQESEYSNDPVRVSLIQDLTKYRTDYVALETSRVALMAAIAQINIDMEKLPAKELEQVRLMREKQSVEDVYTLLKRKYEEAKIQRDAQSGGLIQIEKAEVPEFPVNSRRLYTLLIGLLVGLTIGTGIAFLLEYLDQSIKGIADLEANLKLPLLGGIPGLDSEQTDLAHGIEKENLLEPYRIIRTNLQYSVSGGGSKVFVVTSAMQGEGKSSKSSKLAVSFALTGKKVLLIDADLRRSSQHALFGVDRGRGLSELLTGQLPFIEILKRTSYPGLVLITAGLKPPNPAELLGSATMEQMLRQAREQFDIIIIDTPAALPVTDALVVAPKADAVILIVQAFRTPAKAAQHVRASLDRFGAYIAGCVFNRIPQHKGYAAYYYSYYGYGYRYGYHDYYSDEKLPPTRRDRIESGFVFLRGLWASVCKERKLSHKRRLFAAGLAHRPRLVILTILLIASSVALLGFLIVRPLLRQPAAPEQPAVLPAGLATPGEGRSVEDLAFGAGAPADSGSVPFDSSFETWHRSLAENNANGFLSLYARNGLKCPAGDYPRWESYLRKRFAERPALEVLIGERKQLAGGADTTEVEFPIMIRSASSRVEAVFRQLWVRSGRHWLIIQERIVSP